MTVNGQSADGTQPGRPETGGPQPGRPETGGPQPGGPQTEGQLDGGQEAGGPQTEAKLGSGQQAGGKLGSGQRTGSQLGSGQQAGGTQPPQVLAELQAILARVTGREQLATVTPQTPLFGDGVGLDSLTGTLLLVEIQHWFGVDVAAEDLNLDSLATLGTLAAFIDGHLPSAAPGRVHPAGGWPAAR